MDIRQLPTAASVSTVLEELMGRKVIASVAPGPLGLMGSIVSLYANSRGQLGAALIFDLRIAAGVGAALTMISPESAKESLAAGRLDPMILENFREVCNVLTSLVNEPQTPGEHVDPLAMHGLYSIPPTRPEQIQPYITAAKRRIDVKASIEDYFEGQMAVALMG